MLLKNEVRFLLPYASALLAVMTVYCTSLNTAGTSEVGNPQKVSAVIVDSAGRAVCGVPVALVPGDYNSLRGSIGFQKQLSGYAKAQMLLPSDTSDEYGRVDVELADTGIYNLIATSTVYQYKLFVSSITVGKDAAVNLDTVHLQEPGTLVVTITSALFMPGCVLVMPGSLLAAPVGQPGTTAFTVPSGHVSLRYVTGAGDTIQGAASLKDIIVGEGQTVFATIGGASSAWNYSMRVHLNTTAAGANVAGTVRNFPVLVRLNSGNFNFAEAKTDGSDIRFAKANGAALPYEIERWDASASQAEIWVKVDTVYGNDSAHFITMYWGASTVGSTGSPQGSATVSLSNSTAVFDTTNGFQGVWHLNQPTGSIEKDATYNHFDGAPSDTAPILTEGPLGAAKQFDGTSSFFEMKNTASGNLDFHKNGTYSLSAWVWVDTLNDQSQMIMTKGWRQYFIHIGGGMNSFEFNEYVDQTGYERTWTPAAAKEWHYVTGMRAGSAQYLYVDGVCVDSTLELGLLSTDPRTTTGNLSIGRNPADPWYFFKGKIDEARIMDKAPSADWIKLCYMNQKPNEALIEFQ
jgi:hypothetical protein